MSDSLQGLVIGRAPGYFIVRTDDGATRLCVLRGKMRRGRGGSGRRQFVPARGTTTPTAEREAETPTTVAVGDRVTLTPDSATGGAIEAVLPRRNKLARAAIESTEEQILLANLDLAVLVFAVRDPAPHIGLLDRYLVLTEDAGIDALICFNKMDLGVPADVAEALALYGDLGYDVITTSTVSGQGVAALRDRLAGRVALLTGPSGVGKSSLLNAIEPGAAQRVGEVSASTGKGRHTTTGVRLFVLGDNGWIADSAGIRELAPWRIDSERLAAAFVEFRPLAPLCEFEDCSHDPSAQGCAILAAAEAGRIAPSRYDSYLRLLSELPVT